MVKTIQDEEFIELAKTLAAEYSVLRLKVETPSFRQEYSFGKNSPEITLMKNQVIVRKGSTYAVDDIGEKETPEDAYNRVNEVLKKKLSVYSKKYRERNPEKFRASARKRMRRIREEERSSVEDIAKRR